MKKMNKFLCKVDKAKYMLTTAMMTASAGVPVNAATGGGGQGTNVILSVLDQVVSVLPIAGLIFLFMGAFKLIQAIRADNNPEGISAAVKDFIAAALFVGFPLLLWPTIKSVV